MPSYRELLQQVKDSIEEVDATGRATCSTRPSRRSSSTSASATSGPRGTSPAPSTCRAASSSRGSSRSRPTAPAPLVLYCAGGVRSAFAAKTLAELGYESVISLAGGFTDWKRNGLPCSCPGRSTPRSGSATAATCLIPEVGEEGQLKLLDSRVLLIGAGGLGSPAALYLAAAGIGKIGIVDDDRVDESNLQRQIAHSTADARRVEGRVGEAHDRGAQPRRRGDPVPRAPHLRERRPDPRRRLGRDRRRRRQLPDPLPRQRRRGLARHPARPRLDLPLRGPGHRLQAPRGPVLPLPLPAAAAAGAGAELRRGRRARRPAGHRRLAPGGRGAEARARDRRHARRPAAALRRALDRVQRGGAPPRPGLPGLRRAPDDHRVHRLRRVLLRANSATGRPAHA